jgi:hypothetical protein
LFILTLFSASFHFIRPFIHPFIRYI